MAIDVLGLVLSSAPGTKITGDVEIPIDAAVVVSPRFANEVTGEAVEDGSEITDHIITAPVEVEIEGIISNHPVAIFGGLASGAFGGISDVLGIEQPRQSGYDLLKKAVVEQLLLTVETSLDTYESMVIVSLDVTGTRENANALRFRATFREVRVASTTDTPLTGNLGDLATGLAERGSRPAELL